MRPPSGDDATSPAPQWDEDSRLAALRRYGVIDTPPEAEFDDFTQLAAHICRAPIAVINLIDRDRQWFKSEIGLGVRETPLDVSICKHAILQKGLFVVPDTTLDERFKHNPLVTGAPGLRFYAGALLESSEGLPLGTLCVLDFQPRELEPAAGKALHVLARQIMATLELRLATRELAQRHAALEKAMREIATLEGLLPICAQCKQIRDDDHTWVPIEDYLKRHAPVTFTHGLCPACFQSSMAKLDTIKPITQ
jgi:GAF domain-containing protein